MYKEYGKFDGCILECLEMMEKSRMIGPLSIVYVYTYGYWCEIDWWLYLDCLKYKKGSVEILIEI
jgi:hypothetical protein